MHQPAARLVCGQNGFSNNSTKQSVFIYFMSFRSADNNKSEWNVTRHVWFLSRYLIWLHSLHPAIRNINSLSTPFKYPTSRGCLIVLLLVTGIVLTVKMLNETPDTGAWVSYTRDTVKPAAGYWQLRPDEGCVDVSHFVSASEIMITTQQPGAVMHGMAHGSDNN